MVCYAETLQARLEGTVRARCLNNDDITVVKQYKGIDYYDREVQCGGITVEVLVRGVWKEIAPPGHYTYPSCEPLK